MADTMLVIKWLAPKSWTLLSCNSKWHKYHARSVIFPLRPKNGKVSSSEDTREKQSLLGAMNFEFITERSLPSKWEENIPGGTQHSVASVNTCRAPGSMAALHRGVAFSLPNEDWVGEWPDLVSQRPVRMVLGGPSLWQMMIHRCFTAQKIGSYCKMLKTLVIDFKGNENKSKPMFTLLTGDS